MATSILPGGTLPGGDLGSATWHAIGCRVQVLTTDPAAVGAAEELLGAELDALDRACSRFRDDAEVRALERAGGAPVRVSALLADLVRVALDAAERSGGAVDPTLGAALVDLGYDRDLAALPADGPRVRVHRLADWRDVAVDGDRVRVPAGVLLDLGATAKASCADRSAARLAAELGCGVLVNLGGDLAAAGRAPGDGWAVRVQDRPGGLDHDPDGPWQTVALHAGGLATSSTTARRWQRGGDVLHHLLDPRTGLPARSPWRTVSVAAATCVAANTASTAAVVRGAGALEHLEASGLPARLVSTDGAVVTLGGWP